MPSIKVELPYQPGANVYQGKVETAAVNYTTACGVCECVPALHTWAVSVCQVSLLPSVSASLSPRRLLKPPRLSCPKELKTGKQDCCNRHVVLGLRASGLYFSTYSLHWTTHARSFQGQPKPKTTQSQQQAFLLSSRRRAGDWQRAMFLTPCRVTRSFF